jgi:hypothetical protein
LIGAGAEWARTSTIATAPRLATAALRVRMSLMLRLGSSAVASSAVASGDIGQVARQIQPQNTIAVTSQPTAGA